MRGALLAVLVLGGCARGGSVSSNQDSGVPGADAGEHEPTPDARPDARPDAPPDAPPPPPDACVPVTTQLLVNPLLDGTPRGMGWTEQLIQAGYPLITDQDNSSGPLEHTAPYKAWLGGFTGNNVTDVLYQDVAIPPLTTELVLTGQRQVRTDESTTGTAYDTAQVLVTQTDGTPIVTVLSLSNLTPTAAWTPFNHLFTQNLSGQTVRVRFTSKNDSLYTTSFYFDTLAFTATHGCP